MKEEELSTDPSLGSDLFRRKERAIKAFVKIKSSENRKKRTWYDQQQSTPAAEDDFCWSSVADCRIPSSECFTLIRELESCCSTIPHRCSSQTKIFKISHSEPGLYLLSQALCPDQQLFWATRALEVYSTVEHTNLTNLSKLYEANDPSVGQKSSELKEIEKELNNLWEKSIEENNNFNSFNKLRWSCLGYHYDWTKRSYQKNVKSGFPEELAQLSQRVAELVGNHFVPEAAIVNFYPLHTNMGGHLDDAEHDLSKPIVSLSLGRSAIFLIGGKLKSIDALPILARSGDIVIMSGNSRLCYHGVPAIISQDLEKELTNEPCPELETLCETPESSTRHILEYLKEHRINMNIRQVRIDCSSDEKWIDKSGTGHVKYAP